MYFGDLQEKRQFNVSFYFDLNFTVSIDNEEFIKLMKLKKGMGNMTKDHKPTKG